MGLLYACALVPHFLAALARKENPDLQHRPVIVGRSSETRGSVIACSEEAASAGVTLGMAITRAMVLCPSSTVVPLNEEQVELAERAFVATAAEFCPAVENVQIGHIHADVRGMAQLVRSTPASYLAELQEAMANRTGLPVQLGGAATVFAAHAAAGYLAKPSYYVVHSDHRDLLAPLPVSALPVSLEMLRRLHLFGIERLGQLAELPPSALQAQFGREGLRAWHLVRGEALDRVTPAREAIRVSERLSLPAPAVLSTPIVLGSEILLRRALRYPAIDGRSLRRADLVVELENEERLPLRFVFRESTADQARILFVIRNAIERLKLPSPAIALELTLSGVCSEYVRQERLWQDGPRAQTALGEAIEQLQEQIGGPQVYRVVEVEPWSRIPERQRALQAYSP